MTTLTILGIETSCDETAAAIIVRDNAGRRDLKANIVLSQINQHAPYGGVVPEIAARAHVLHLDRLISQAMDEAKLDFADLDGIAATAGPGLLGGVLVGLTTAKALAMAHNKPLLAINHLEGHALTPGLTEGIKPPYLLLLVSGGHTQILAVADVGNYTRYGTTIDDALGEAFDKTAKLLGLGFPGGPAVEKFAQSGDKQRFNLPRPMKGRAGCDFSFSGLKTAIRQTAEGLQPITDTDIADLCASFETAVSDTVSDRLDHAMTQFQQEYPEQTSPRLVVAGGVAANLTLRAAINTICQTHGFALVVPPVALCTDNAAMIAWAGGEHLARGLSDPLNFAARARWPLDMNGKPAPFAGVKA